MKRALLACVLALGTGGPQRAPQAQQPGGWLVWWAEGQKAARATGKPIFMVFR